MVKVIKDNTIYFYDNENNEIMYVNYSTDECIWYFNSNQIINITPDMELYNLLNNFMDEEYYFSDTDTILKNYKDNNKLVWYSDCYYNPDNEWSIAAISCLNIERKTDRFIIWCTKKIDEIVERPNKTYGVCFSPSGNGQYSKNLKTSLTLQDDFVTHIYQPLLEKNIKKSKKIKYI